MKVTKTLHPAYQPYSITLAIESQEAHNMLEALTARDCIVPAYLASQRYIDNAGRSVMSDILRALHYATQSQ